MNTMTQPVDVFLEKLKLLHLHALEVQKAAHLLMQEAGRREARDAATSAQVSAGTWVLSAVRVAIDTLQGASRIGPRADRLNEARALLIPSP